MELTVYRKETIYWQEVKPHLEVRVEPLTGEMLFSPQQHRQEFPAQTPGGIQSPKPKVGSSCTFQACSASSSISWLLRGSRHALSTGTAQIWVFLGGHNHYFELQGCSLGSTRKGLRAMAAHRYVLCTMQA